MLSQGGPPSGSSDGCRRCTNPQRTGPTCSNSTCMGNKTRAGDPKRLLDEGTMYNRRRAESGQGHPHFISFNQEIKALSGFKLSIHGRGPLIQLRFLGEEKWRAGEWRRGHVSCASPPILCRHCLSTTIARAEPLPCPCPDVSPRVSAVVAEEDPCPSLTKISGTFFFFRFSFTTRGEIPGRVVSGAQGFTETLGTSANFESTTGETPAKSSAASSPSKPKQDWRPGVEVDAEPKVSRRLYERLTFFDISKSLASKSPFQELDSAFTGHSTGVEGAVTGTLQVWKRSSLVSFLLGGLFSFSNKEAICSRTEERMPPSYLTVLLTSRKAQGSKMSIQSLSPFWSPARHWEDSREENKEYTPVSTGLPF